MTDKQNSSSFSPSNDSSRYESPIPDRDAISNWVGEQVSPCGLTDMSKGLGIAGDEGKMDGLERRLRAMVRDGQLVRNDDNLFTLPNPEDLISGRVIGHRDGFGFVARDDGEKDLFLGPRQMRKVIDGDKVTVRILGKDFRGRIEASIISITERKRTRLVGKITQGNREELFTPDNTKINQQFTVLPHPEVTDVEGKNVEVQIMQPPSGKFLGQVKITNVLGNANAPGMEIQVAVRTHGLPFEWTDEVLKQTKKFGTEVKEGDKQQRIDLRNTPLVTIDGLDARDFDDAVYCEPMAGGAYRLIVAIADVSHYVKQGTPLDEEAYSRGTSVYFPDQVIPMLPEALSNGLCSLNPDVDRLCMICDMTISSEGEIAGYQFYEAVMRSHARLTYDQVGNLLEDPQSSKANKVRAIVGDLEGHLINLYGLYHVLKAARAVRGAIEFETPETYIVFDEYRKIEKIVPRTRNDAHKIIEECMLCANVATARLLNEHKLPGLFRNHEHPKEEKFAQLSDYLKSLGIPVFTSSSSQITPKDYQAILEQIKDRPDFPVVQIRLLRSMNQAVYRGKNIGHFGLNYSEYAHFTSPIRRYPDLLTHRTIRWLIRSEKANSTTGVLQCEGVTPLKESEWLLDASCLDAAGEHCSSTERRADEASREVEDKLKCEYMRQHLGAEFDGIVSGVTGFGLFVELDEIFIEGLIHVSSLNSDYYNYDQVQQTLKGEKTNMVFAMGTPVRVQVAGVSVEDRKIDLQLVEAFGKPITAAPKRPSKKKKSSKKPYKKGGESKTARKQNSGGNSAKRGSNKPNAIKPKRSNANTSKPKRKKSSGKSAKAKFDQEVTEHVSTTKKKQGLWSKLKRRAKKKS